MLNDKSRSGVKHLPVPRKWINLAAGMVLRLPQSEIRGGWGAGWYDFLPVHVESFDRHAEFATVRSLTDRRHTFTIRHRQLEYFAEHAPFGTMQRSRTPRYERPWFIPSKKKPRYV